MGRAGWLRLQVAHPAALGLAYRDGHSCVRPEHDRVQCSAIALRSPTRPLASFFLSFFLSGPPSDIHQIFINAPEGCPHGTHTNRTAYIMYLSLSQRSALRRPVISDKSYIVQQRFVYS